MQLNMLHDFSDVNERAELSTAVMRLRGWSSAVCCEAPSSHPSGAAGGARSSRKLPPSERHPLLLIEGPRRVRTQPHAHTHLDAARDARQAAQAGLLVLAQQRPELLLVTDLAAEPHGQDVRPRARPAPPRARPPPGPRGRRPPRAGLPRARTPPRARRGRLPRAGLPPLRSSSARPPLDTAAGRLVELPAEPIEDHLARRLPSLPQVRTDHRGQHLAEALIQRSRLLVSQRRRVD